MGTIKIVIQSIVKSPQSFKLDVHGINPSEKVWSTYAPSRSLYDVHLALISIVFQKGRAERPPSEHDLPHPPFQARATSLFYNTRA